MEQRKEIVRKYVFKGLSVMKAVQATCISKSSYYYKPNGGRKGKRPSRYTLKGEQPVLNEEVAERIEGMLSGDDYIDYGYFRTCKALQKEGYFINHKKVYRLMREKKLLFPPIKAGQRMKRDFVKFTVPKLEHPFATVEMDIKYLYIYGQKRNAYLLTLIDTFTRSAVEWTLDMTMKSDQVAKLLNSFSQNPLIADYKNSCKIMIRTDNGPQFLANLLSNQIKEFNFHREFIHPATPQENGHIESFHNTFTRLVSNKYAFESLSQARDVLKNFYYCYNNKRIMKSILYCTPIEFLKNWEQGKIGIDRTGIKEKFFFRERQPAEPVVLSSEAF